MVRWFYCKFTIKEVMICALVRCSWVESNTGIDQKFLHVIWYYATKSKSCAEQGLLSGSIATKRKEPLFQIEMWELQVQCSRLATRKLSVGLGKNSRSERFEGRNTSAGCHHSVGIITLIFGCSVPNFRPPDVVIGCVLHAEISEEILLICYDDIDVVHTA